MSQNPKLQRLIEGIDDHIPGKGCECHAYYDGECGCSVDWTPRETFKLRAIMSYVTKELGSNFGESPEAKQLLTDIDYLMTHAKPLPWTTPQTEST
jgi:hypothetical protein